MQSLIRLIRHFGYLKRVIFHDQEYSSLFWAAEIAFTKRFVNFTHLPVEPTSTMHTYDSTPLLSEYWFSQFLLLSLEIREVPLTFSHWLMFVI